MGVNRGGGGLHVYLERSMILSIEYVKSLILPLPWEKLTELYLIYVTPGSTHNSSPKPNIGKC